MSPSERVAVLASIRQVAVNLSSLPGRFGIQGETFYWTAGYHLNIRLYQKLLFAVFDVLDEGQFIEVDSCLNCSQFISMLCYVNDAQFCL